MQSPNPDVLKAVNVAVDERRGNVSIGQVDCPSALISTALATDSDDTAPGHGDVGRLDLTRLRVDHLPIDQSQIAVHVILQAGGKIGNSGDCEHTRPTTTIINLGSPNGKSYTHRNGWQRQDSLGTSHSALTGRRTTEYSQPGDSTSS